MFERLKNKWQVNNLQLILILCTFAIGGSITGRLGKSILSYIGIEHPVLYVLAYLVLLTIIWPFMVLIVSIPLGQLSFFRKYLIKIGKRFRILKK